MHGEILKKIIKDTRLNQNDLATILEVKPQYISAIRHNQRNFSDEHIKKLEETLNIKFSDYEYLILEKNATPERPEWLQNLTEKEESQLQKMIEQDKELLSLFFSACTGDKQKLKLFCKYLSDKYGVDL